MFEVVTYYSNSGVVGNFLLWERCMALCSQILSWWVVGAGVHCTNEWFFIKVKSMFKHVGKIFEIMEKYCNTSLLRCRVVRNVVNFFARMFGICYSNKYFLKIWFNWVHSRVYFDIIM